LVTQASPFWCTYHTKNGAMVVPRTSAAIAIVITGIPAIAAPLPPLRSAWSRTALITIEKASTSAGTYLASRSK